MANVRYVDVDAAAGGDGTTNALTGANCAYQSLAIWEAARQAVLTDIEECVCESNGGSHTADTTAVTIDGWTTTSAYYIYIHTSTAGRHDGKWNTGKYRLEAGGNTLNILERYTRIEGLQIYQLNSGGWNDSGIYINLVAPNAVITYNIVKSALVNEVDISGGGALIRYGYNTVTPGNEKIYNNILYGKGGTYGAGINIYDYAGNFYIYNNTLINNSYGIHNQYVSSIVAKNNIVKGSGNTNAYSGTFASGTDYNATDGTDDIGQGTHNRISQTFTFADEANDDFHLASNDAGARNYGIDLSADAALPFSTDIDGETRPGESVWDIGADEYISAGYTLTCDTGAFTETGQIASLLASRLVPANAGGFALTGFISNLLKSSLVSCDSGVYALTGQETSLLLHRLISAGTEIYNLTGQELSLLKSSLMDCVAGSFSETGQESSLLKSSLVDCGSGVYDLTGQVVSLLMNRVVICNIGEYSLVGIPLDLLRSVLVSAGIGEYVLTGMSADLTFQGIGVGVSPYYYLMLMQNRNN